MSNRYTNVYAGVVTADCVPPGEQVGEDRLNGWGLVLDDQFGEVWVLEGSRDEMRDFLARSIGAIEDTYRAEHANALHFKEPDEACPECREDAAEH
jgi:hypothetical protein